MEETVNPVHPQAGPVAFLALCVLGVVVAVSRIVGVAVGSESWQTVVAFLLMDLAAFVFIIGGWLWVQRELTFTRDSVRVRRWLEVLLGQEGHGMPLDGETRMAIVLVNVRSLRLEHDGFSPIQLTLGYWEPHEVRHLVDVIRTRNVHLDQYWMGDFPPG